MPDIEVLQPAANSTGSNPSSANNNNNNNIAVDRKPAVEVMSRKPPALFADDEKKSSKVQELRTLVESKFQFFNLNLALVTYCMISSYETTGCG